ncbi:hypothetical protein BVRB_9g224220 [Beta vulgaris subsp. vulgaris]|nr:hypothetical protein BVRB_9g224220 [Beta vulgaris subsp. vulgaris]
MAKPRSFLNLLAVLLICLVVANQGEVEALCSRYSSTFSGICLST